MSNQSELRRDEEAAAQQPKKVQGDAAHLAEKSMEEVNAEFKQLTEKYHKEYEEYLRRDRIKMTYR